ncbi:MAG TPA: MBL fold metallo-hydrolase [Ignavibacteriaceae bacterium]|nr:MBL fold metallo-hydrolase [Ignavibacteriaceae bacterium]
MTNFFPLGGAGEIGANCYYLNIAGTGIIIDCGIHPQKTGKESLPEFDLLNNRDIDYVLISHAHQDHLSGLPFLVQKYPYIKIITTPQTRALAELTLHDTVSILKQQVQEEELKIYSHEEIDLLIQSIEYRSFKEEFEIQGYNHQDKEGIKVTFFDAGHILGAASILIEYNGNKIFYTGDINLKPQSWIKGASLPKGKVNSLILETTYGATDSSTINKWEKEAERFTEASNRIINEGGSILIPVFSLGKMQEMLKTIWQMMEDGKLAKVDIYTGGIARKISRVYDYNRYVVNCTNSEFELNAVPQKDLYEIENPEEFFKHPCIVLATSGMMVEGTASFRLAQRWLKQMRSAIFTVGYMEKETPGFIVSTAKKGMKIRLSELSEEIEVNCTIEGFRFSAHSKREDLIKITDKLNPEKVILIHGDPPAINWVGAAILKENNRRKVYAAEIGKEITLDQ